MSLEAVEKVAETEQKNKERRTAAALEAKELLAGAQKDGLALLSAVREKAKKENKERLRQAEDRGNKRAEALREEAQHNADALRTEAKAHLTEAAEQIVGRVVK
ncbi:MAG: hypothetical protein LKJ86_01575 [Oscillibacter sp.]|nr:hypothetical protein [Oscillibacter sp.]